MHRSASRRCPTTRRSPKRSRGLKQRGFSVEVVDDLDAARRAVLARIPEGSSVMTYPSVTLLETGIVQAIDDGGPLRLGAYQGAGARPRDAAAGDQGDHGPARLRPRQRPRDHARWNPRHRVRSGQPARLLCLGRRERHLRRRRAEARSRPRRGAPTDLEHCLTLEDARTLEAYGKNSRVGKILEIHQEDPGRIHVVADPARVGF